MDSGHSHTDETRTKESYIYRRSEHQRGLDDKIRGLEVEARQMKKSQGLLDIHCNENPINVFLFWELCGLSPNFHIHVSASDLYSPRIGLHISSSRTGRPIVGIYQSLTDT
jgi:hypothetical protein